MPIKHVVELKECERSKLKDIVSKDKVAARKRLRAQILLKADQGKYNPNAKWTDLRIAQAFDVTERTVQNVRKRLVEEGLDITLERPRPSRPTHRKLDGAAEARLIAECCTTPPEGAAKWSLRLLGKRMVELEIVDSINHETIRKTLKKRGQTLAQ